MTSPMTASGESKPTCMCEATLLSPFLLYKKGSKISPTDKRITSFKNIPCHLLIDFFRKLNSSPGGHYIVSYYKIKCGESSHESTRGDCPDLAAASLSLYSELFKIGNTFNSKFEVTDTNYKG